MPGGVDFRPFSKIPKPSNLETKRATTLESSNQNLAEYSRSCSERRKLRSPEVTRDFFSNNVFSCVQLQLMFVLLDPFYRRNN